MQGTDKSYIQVYARNCVVRRVPKLVAKEFIDTHHFLGYTNCRYRYGIFVEKQGKGLYEPGTLVSVATFAGPRKWEKGDKIIKSYEWVRFVSLPNTRVAGGMGKVLSTFIEEVEPDDIMTYVDATMSNGKSYKQLGFKEDGEKTFPNGAHSLKLRLKLVDY